MVKTVLPGSLSGRLAVMPSKSASHRAVMMAAMASGQTLLEPLQLSKDIAATLSCARSLGLLSSSETAPHALPGFVSCRISGGNVPEPAALRELDCGESGSTLRFFIPLALDGRGPVRFIGHGRLMQRPLSLYEDLFRPLGISWKLSGDALTVNGQLRSGVYALRGDVSSQFITGLLLALPRLSGGSRIELTTPLESRAYVELTRSAQAAFGIVSRWENNGQALVIPGNQTPHSPGKLHVESDWSHAAFPLVAGSIGRGSVTLTGLDPDSAQGDKAIVSLLTQMGADIQMDASGVTAHPAKLRGITADVSQVPDLVPVLAVAMTAAEGESRITGAARLRIKESDRLAAMRAALLAAGADVTELPDGLVIRGGKRLHAASIDGCNDHRIVMAMAVASAIADGPLSISDAEAVGKSAPAFWQEFEQLGGQAQ